MPEVTIKIGDRPFTVACPRGEEGQLKAASAKLNAEATLLLTNSGIMPEAQMLLMSGLMLSDRALALEENLIIAEAEITRLRQYIKNIVPENKTLVEEFKLIDVSENLLKNLTKLSACAESAADNLEQKLAQPVL